VTEGLRADGIRLAMPHTMERLEKTGDGLRVTLDDGSELLVDQVLCALGRRPLVQGLGLEAADVELDEAGAIVVDEYSRTSTANVFAVGDVTNRINLTPVAIAEGSAVAQTLFNNTPTRPDHRDVPSAVFSTPSVGTVGMTEAEARAAHPEIFVYRSEFRELKHTLSGRVEKAYMKLIVHADTDKVLGLHMVGDHAADIVQGFAVAIKMGATKADFDRTIGIHPTAAEEFVTMRKRSP
jgi:glutathione reductase (NADPH)